MKTSTNRKTGVKMKSQAAALLSVLVEFVQAAWVCLSKKFSGESRTSQIETCETSKTETSGSETSKTDYKEILTGSDSSNFENHNFGCDSENKHCKESEMKNPNQQDVSAEEINRVGTSAVQANSSTEIETGGNGMSASEKLARARSSKAKLARANSKL